MANGNESEGNKGNSSPPTNVVHGGAAEAAAFDGFFEEAWRIFRKSWYCGEVGSSVT